MKATFYLHHGDLVLTSKIWTKEVSTWKELADFCSWFVGNNIVDEEDRHTLEIECKQGPFTITLDNSASLSRFVMAISRVQPIVELEYEPS